LPIILGITEATVLKPILHGGDLGEIMRRFPNAPKPWLDLSTGINPVPYPVGALADESWARLPSRHDEQALLAAAAKRYGVRDQATLLAAPGTQALIQLLPRLVPKSRVAVLGPTYEEHEASWARQGHDVRVVDDVAQAAGADVLVVVNPDNPTGRLLSAEELGHPSRLLVVDEAFIDFLPAAASLAGNLPPRTIVLRSFGKTYGLAGLRLGFAIGAPDLIARLAVELGPWAVSGPALAIGRKALADDDWLAIAKARLERDGQRLDDLLAAAGCAPVSATPLFRLVRHDDVREMIERLGRHGIHVRAFGRQASWLRLGLPGNDGAFRRLASAL
jgi:cobalamin biosynthetic protein CobC